MGAVAIRPGLAEDFDAMVAVWRAASAARRGGVAVRPEREEQVRCALRKPDAFLLVADDGGDTVRMALGVQGRADDGAGPPVPGPCFIPLVYVAPER